MQSKCKPTLLLYISLQQCSLSGHEAASQAKVQRKKSLTYLPIYYVTLN